MSKHAKVEKRTACYQVYVCYDNTNKFNLINKIELHAETLKTHPNPTIKKSEVLIFLSLVNKSLKKSL